MPIFTLIDRETPANSLYVGAGIINTNFAYLEDTVLPTLMLLTETRPFVPFRAAVDDGDTSPVPGAVGAVLWSTTENIWMWWDGSKWNKACCETVTPPPPPPPPTNLVSATITLDSVGESGVTVTFTDTTTSTVIGTEVTDSLGSTDSVSAIVGNTVQASFTLSGTDFTWTDTESGAGAGTTASGVMPADAYTFNFTGTTSPPPPTTFSISGTVTNASAATLDGRTVSVTSGGSGSAVTDISGVYTITGLSNGTYTVAPTLSGLETSTPASHSVTIAGANQTGKDFDIATVGGEEGGGGKGEEGGPR